MGEIVVKVKPKGGAQKDPDEKKSEGPHRTGIAMDMTPMVDVAFLLLIFFMVTTVFRRPLAMEINMPEPGAKVLVPESNVMTLYVLDDTHVLSRTAKNPVVPIEWDELEMSMRRGMEANDKLIILVKIDPAVRYERMVDMMDILDDAHMTRFSLVPLTAADRWVTGGAP